jgi:Acetoacetate decarboxylase (ADC)
MTTTQPFYIDRSAEQVYLPPFKAVGTGLFAFAVQADLNVLQTRICDRYLNAPLGGGRRFCPALSQVFFVFNTVDSLRAESAGWQDKGWFSEKEAAVWMLVADHETERLFWFHPYMLVDNAYALSMGREIYGFPKALGWFDIPTGPNAPQHLSVETLAVKDYTLSTQGLRAPLFSIHQVGPGSSAPLEAGITEMSELVVELAKMAHVDGSWFETLGLAAHLIDDLLHLRLPMVFLKQFRDGADPTRCCYQAIQEVNVQLTEFHSARIYTEKYQLDINDLASHPVRADLGLPPGPIPVEFAFWSNFDFTIGACNAIWSTSK